MCVRPHNVIVNVVGKEHADQRRRCLHFSQRLKRYVKKTLPYPAMGK